MSVEPTPGLVIRFDFLWREERDAGADFGRKDRPCVIVIHSREREDGSKEVVVCPITHSPPNAGQTAVAIPVKVARFLNLDSEKMWVKTDAINTFSWPKGQIPVGMVPTPTGEWSHGKIPNQLRAEIFDQVKRNSRGKILSGVQRDDPTHR